MIALTVTRVTIGSPRDCSRCHREMRLGTPAIREIREGTDAHGWPAETYLGDGRATAYRHVTCPREDAKPEPESEARP